MVVVVQLWRLLPSQGFGRRAAGGKGVAAIGIAILVDRKEGTAGQGAGRADRGQVGHCHSPCDEMLRCPCACASAAPGLAQQLAARSVWREGWRAVRGGIVVVVDQTGDGEVGPGQKVVSGLRGARCGPCNARLCVPETRACRERAPCLLGPGSPQKKKKKGGFFAASTKLAVGLGSALRLSRTRQEN